MSIIRILLRRDVKTKTSISFHYITMKIWEITQQTHFEVSISFLFERSVHWNIIERRVYGENGAQEVEVDADSEIGSCGRAV